MSRLRNSPGTPTGAASGVISSVSRPNTSATATPKSCLDTEGGDEELEHRSLAGKLGLAVEGEPLGLVILGVAAAAVGAV